MDYDKSLDSYSGRSFSNDPVQICGQLYKEQIDESFNLQMQIETKRVNVREKAIMSEALRKGSNAGLYHRYGQYLQEIKQSDYQAKLDQAFNFRVLSIDYLMMPPVIAEAGESIEVKAGGKKAVTTSGEWEIVKDATLVTHPPTWRNYLLRYNFGLDDGEVTPALQPRNGREQKLWNRYLCNGVKQGFKQADRLFKQAMAELVRDFNGMLLFRKLNLQGVVNRPIVKHYKKGTKTNGKILWVNKREHIINKPTRFKMPKKWNPPVIYIKGKKVSKRRSR